MGKNSILRGQVYPFDDAESTVFEARGKSPVGNNGKRREPGLILKTLIVVLTLSIVAGVTSWLVIISRGGSKDKIVEPVENRIAEHVKNTIAEPVKNTIADPVEKINAKPVENIIVNPLKKKVVKPVEDKVVKPVEDKVVKPVENKIVDHLKNKIVDHLKNKIIGPLKNKIIDPLKNKIIDPLKNTIVAPLKNTIVAPPKNTDTMPADEPAVCEHNADKKCTNEDIDSLTTRYTEDMLQISKERNIVVLHGDYDTCNNACIRTECVREGKCVYDWELKAVANVIARAKFKITPSFELDLLLKYKKYIIHFGKRYSDYLHFQRRYHQFRKTTIEIDKHNKDPNNTYKKGHTSFADLTPPEIGMIATDVDIFDIPTKYDINGENSQISRSEQTPKKNLKITELKFFDWRDFNVVTPVINQRRCGSCWAVSSTGILSSFMAIRTDVLKPYSIQQVLDCTGPPYNCSYGGDHYKALLYISKNPMCTEDEYPYIAESNKCLASKCKHKVPIKEIVSLKGADARKHLREHGPFLTSFRLGRGFLLYDSGIYNGDCDSKMVHSVYVVGYGHDDKYNLDYWIVKNSWGPYWGEDGYIRIVDIDVGNGKHCKFLNRAYGIIGQDE